MTKKPKTQYVCTSCGTAHSKWMGQCTGCGEWNTLVAETVAPTGGQQGYGWTPAAAKSCGAIKARQLEHLPAEQVSRIPLPDGELARALGGGLVPGSMLLLGGEPGIGKSTLLLQLSKQMAGTILYVSGEESAGQIKMRADRIQGRNDNLYIYTETELSQILEQAAALAPQLLLIDSIQTIYHSQIESIPGSAGQIRDCTGRLLRFAKDTGTAVLLVGHITKEGAIAGPKLLEHMVDVVLEFEGDRYHNYRLLRAVKNRFGPTPELAIYEMLQTGLRQVTNPSELFLSTSGQAQAGVAVCATLQGARPLLLEVQALVSPAAYGNPQRSVTGFDQKRLNMLLAVLEKRCGLKLAMQDVFVNIAGGLKVDDPAMDLAVAAAIISSLLDAPPPAWSVYSGEISLTGDIRPVPKLDQRATEAARLGYRQLYCSAAAEVKPPKGLALNAHQTLAELVRNGFAY